MRPSLVREPAVVNSRTTLVRSCGRLRGSRPLQFIGRGWFRAATSAALTEARRQRGAFTLVEDMLRLAVERLPDQAFLTLDKSGLITSWNSGAERLLGHRREQTVGEHVSAILAGHGGAGGIGMQDLEQSERQGFVSSSRWLTHEDGSALHVKTTVLAIQDDADLVGYAVVAYEQPLPTAVHAGVSEGRAGGADSDQTDRQLSELKALLAAEMADRTQAEADRIRLLRRLVVAQEEERRRIARDLHDDLGQRLTALRLMLEALDGTTGLQREQSATVANALQTLTRIDQDLDFIAWELRPAALDELGLVKVLNTYVEEWSRHAAIPAAFHARPASLERLAPEVEASVYRIAQEALNNVAKHAGARSVNVLLELRGPNVALVVEDDGIGFDPGASGETMLGVIGMRERALAVGGTIEIEPTPNGGTTVLACIPTAVGPVDRRRAAVVVDGTTGPQPGLPERDAESGDANGSAARSIRLRLQELQRAVGARDEFIATVAHELRNPISPLTFQVRLALNKTEQMAAAGTSVSVEWIQSQLRGVEQRLHRLLETLDRLLDVSRLSTGRIDLQPEPMNLAVVLRDVVGTLEAELAVARCKLTLSEQGETTGSWDRLRVEQICRNLLSNAIRFGAGRPIEVSVTGDHDYAIVRVRDHGIGIAPDQQSRIFERFERGGEQRSGGFGIGLWIVRNICVAMGGTVSVESELGSGACFTVMLPRRARESIIAASEGSEWPN
jgi:PAS domain S-box-containing protein